MADNIKKAKMMPKGGGVVIVVSGWPLAVIIAGGIGYFAYRHCQTEHKSGLKNCFSIFKKDESHPKRHESKESVKKYEDIKIAVDQHFKKTKQKAEDGKVVSEDKCRDLKTSSKDTAHK